jgi:catechol 2,3-dioxygenase-like lactoylglutathione lyase family enzyme
MTEGTDSSGIAPERWNRTDWWGVVLDTDDPPALLRFYSELRGWKIWKSEPEGGALDLGEGVSYLSVQLNPDYVRPAWPGQPGQQQMMLHLDFQVTDLAAEVERAISLGAQLADYQPQDNVRVLLDPAGHPFCLYA